MPIHAIAESLVDASTDFVPHDQDRSVLAEAFRRLDVESSSDESAVHSSHSDHSSNAW